MKKYLKPEKFFFFSTVCMGRSESLENIFIFFSIAFVARTGVWCLL